jgi:hypothetical protein
LALLWGHNTQTKVVEIEGEFYLSSWAETIGQKKSVIRGYSSLFLFRKRFSLIDQGTGKWIKDT